MSTIDDFSLPKEWITDETRTIVRGCRELVEKEICPIRKKLDEDWKEHKLYEPLFRKILVEFGYQRIPLAEEIRWLGTGCDNLHASTGGALPRRFWLGHGM